MKHKNPPKDSKRAHPRTAKDTGFFYKDGRPIPPTHADHGPMDQLPRQEDGSFAAYYYCTKDEIRAGSIDGPPPRRLRHDGWTSERIKQFLEALRSTASIKDACRIVGKSRQSAYNLYNRKDSAHVREAWDEALRACTNILASTAFDRAVNGTEEQVYHKGEFVGWRDKHDNRHLQWMLRARDPLNWAPLHEVEGWLRHRGVEKTVPMQVSLKRFAEAEKKWGSRLPNEGNKPQEKIGPEPEKTNALESEQSAPTTEKEEKDEAN